MSPDAAVVPDEEQVRKEWLERRRTGLGGSDAAAVLGLSAWKSPLALWAEKSGLVEEPNLDELEWIEWGRVLEEPIAAKYVRVTGRKLIDHGRHALRVSAERPWMHCTIDREIVPIDERGPGDLSIKNAGAYKARDWEEEPPLPYQVQIMHELAVTGMQWASFAVLIGGNRFHWCDLGRNERFISYLIEKEEEFWDRVTRGEPPAADASDSTREVLMRLYPRDTGASRDLPPEASGWLERRRALKAEEKRIQGELQEVENLIKAAIGDASIGLVDGIPCVSWKHQRRDGYTVPPADYRVLREIIQKKGKRS